MSAETASDELAFQQKKKLLAKNFDIDPADPLFNLLLDESQADNIYRILLHHNTLTSVSLIAVGDLVASLPSKALDIRNTELFMAALGTIWCNGVITGSSTAIAEILDAPKPSDEEMKHVVSDVNIEMFERVRDLINESLPDEIGNENG